MHAALQIFRWAHLHSAFINIVLIASACCLTWQRGRSFDWLIQGTARRCRDIFYKHMDSKDDESSKRVPAFDGRLDAYRDFRKRALLYYYGLEDGKQILAGPRLIANLSGSAFEVFRERDPGDFRHENGLQQVLNLLDARFQFTPEQELSDNLENALYRIRRKKGEETTSFTTRFETVLAKVEELITEEVRQERQRQIDVARTEYRRRSLDFMVALSGHQSNGKSG